MFSCFCGPAHDQLTWAVLPCRQETPLCSNVSTPAEFNSLCLFKIRRFSTSPRPFSNWLEMYNPWFPLVVTNWHRASKEMTSYVFIANVGIHWRLLYWTHSIPRDIWKGKLIVWNLISKESHYYRRHCPYTVHRCLITSLMRALHVQAVGYL